MLNGPVLLLTDLHCNTRVRSVLSDQARVATLIRSESTGLCLLLTGGSGLQLGRVRVAETQIELGSDV